MTFYTPDEITANRLKFVSGLRENPRNYVRIVGQLHDGNNGRCAVGAACEYLGIPVKMRIGAGPYSTLQSMLNIDASTIWRMNDRESLSYGEIADEAATRWGLE